MGGGACGGAFLDLASEAAVGANRPEDGVFGRLELGVLGLCVDVAVAGVFGRGVLGWTLLERGVLGVDGGSFGLEEVEEVYWPVSCALSLGVEAGLAAGVRGGDLAAAAAAAWRVACGFGVGEEGGSTTGAGGSGLAVGGGDTETEGALLSEVVVVEFDAESVAAAFGLDQNADA